MEQERKRELRAHKDHLNEFLIRIGQIEKAQMDTDDNEKLREYLDEVTRVKLQALEELTDERLRGDNMFTILLMQYANVARKIESKLGRSRSAATSSMSATQSHDKEEGTLQTSEDGQASHQ